MNHACSAFRRASCRSSRARAVRAPHAPGPHSARVLDSMVQVGHPPQRFPRAELVVGLSMNDIEQGSYSAAADKFYLMVLCLFIGSVFAALVFEVIWFQLLEFIIGSTAISIAVLLGTFMGGMCLGSFAFARIVPASLHPLKVYAAMELGIGLFAILIWNFLPSAADLYASIAGHGSTGILLRALLCAAFLLAPTLRMGATLPFAARWVESTPRGVSWLGILYTGNLAGAVLGCLLAGFFLLRLYVMATATFAA